MIVKSLLNTYFTYFLKQLGFSNIVKFFILYVLNI